MKTSPISLGPYLETRSGAATEAQLAALHTVQEALKRIPDEDFECFDNEVLERQSWRQMRHLARAALEQMGWPVEPPPGLSESEPGVWRRS